MGIRAAATAGIIVVHCSLRPALSGVIDDWAERQRRAAPTQGSALLIYSDETDGGRQSIVGLDVGSLAWFVISEGDVVAQIADGSQFQMGVSHAGVVEPEHKINPGVIDAYFPFMMLTDLAREPLRSRIQSVESTEAGGFVISLSLVLGSLYMTEQDLPESWGDRYEENRLYVDEHGRLIEDHDLIDGVVEILEYDERSPAEFPFVTRRALVDPPAGKMLDSIEYYPEGRPDLFTSEGVRTIYETLGHLTMKIPVLPEGVSWTPPGEGSIFTDDELAERQSEVRNLVEQAGLPEGTTVRRQRTRWFLPAGVLLLLGAIVYRFKKST